MIRSLTRFLQGQRKPQIEVFVRHCHYSAASAHKIRFATFSKEKCFQNLLQTVGGKDVNLTFFLDTFHPSDQTHFLRSQDRYPIVEIQAGTEAQSFLAMLAYVLRQKFRPDTIIYFLEDDYIHKEGWTEILREAFTLPNVDYATLYDHKDKYFLPDYEQLQSQIFHTHSCHWRTTPSTTNTYAMRFQTLEEHSEIHRAFSEGRKITADHDKFFRLKEEKRAILISSIPGWATHGEPEFASPCADWEKILESSLQKPAGTRA